MSRLEARVTRAYEEFIASGQFRFRWRGDATRLGDVLKFGWEMVPTCGGDLVASGLEFLTLEPDGRIRTDSQPVEQ